MGKWPLFSPRTPQQARSSSLILQILLFSNLWYSILYWCIVLITFVWKWWSLPLDRFTIAWKIIYGIALGLFTLAEPPRLFLGYMGNLCEEARHLVAFIVLSVLPQLVIAGGVFGQPIIYPFETFFSGTLLLFLLAEIFFSVGTARRVVRANTHRWRTRMAFTKHLPLREEDATRT